jgi:hypothetical protein
MTPLEEMGDSDGSGIDMHQFEDYNDPSFVGPPAPSYFGRTPERKFSDHYEA